MRSLGYRCSRGATFPGFPRYVSEPGVVGVGEVHPGGRDVRERLAGAGHRLDGVENLARGSGMTSFLAFLRGINVGGKNVIAMSDLAAFFRAAGYENVRTHGQSGNVLFDAKSNGGRALESAVEKVLEDRFGFPILVVVRSRDELAATIAAAPADHGSDRLRSDVFFLKDPRTAETVHAELPELREGVDSVTLGPGALYFSRVAGQATKTRIQRLMAMPVFQQMTVRTWRTTIRLLELVDRD